MSKEYNGHPSKGHWNVALWIGNDEPIYRFAMDCIAGAKAKNAARWVAIAAHRFLAVYGEEKTPDGFKYTTARVRAALRDLGE
jgi:hypothetical protein